MRGKGTRKHRKRVLRGITPAYAGKRTCQTVGTAGNEDHPRVCGEKDDLKEYADRLKGSPPRMRGKETLKL